MVGILTDDIAKVMTDLKTIHHAITDDIKGVLINNMPAGVMMYAKPADIAEKAASDIIKGMFKSHQLRMKAPRKFSL